MLHIFRSLSAAGKTSLLQPFGTIRLNRRELPTNLKDTCSLHDITIVFDITTIYKLLFSISYVYNIPFSFSDEYTVHYILVF